MYAGDVTAIVNIPTDRLPWWCSWAWFANHFTRSTPAGVTNFHRKLYTVTMYMSQHVALRVLYKADKTHKAYTDINHLLEAFFCSTSNMNFAAGSSNVKRKRIQLIQETVVYTDCLERRTDDQWLDDRDRAVPEYLQTEFSLIVVVSFGGHAPNNRSLESKKSYLSGFRSHLLDSCGTTIIKWQSHHVFLSLENKRLLTYSLTYLPYLLVCFNISRAILQNKNNMH